MMSTTRKNVFPLPPSQLITRVRSYDHHFLQIGFVIYSDRKRLVETCRRLETFGWVLDWGCGCSQVLRHLLDDLPAERVGSSDTLSS